MYESLDFLAVSKRRRSCWRSGNLPLNGDFFFEAPLLRH
jgi:hypothetical protein